MGTDAQSLTGTIDSFRMASPMSVPFSSALTFEPVGGALSMLSIPNSHTFAYNLRTVLDRDDDCLRLVTETETCQ